MSGILIGLKGKMKSVLVSYKQGDIAENLFIGECFRRDYLVLNPINSLCVYDFIVDSGDKLTKVQVKSTTVYHNNKVTFRMKRSNDSSYFNCGIDVFALYSFTNCNWYIVPERDIIGRITLTITEDFSNKYKNKFEYL